MKDKLLLRKIMKRIDKFPLGGDGNLLRNIALEIEERFCGLDLFNTNNHSLAKYSIFEIKKIIANLVGLSNSTDILKLSDKLVNYDYEVYFAPQLYRDLLAVEKKMRRLRDLIEPTLQFMESDHKQYFDSLLDDVFDNNYVEISQFLGKSFEYKEHYNQTRSEFKNIMFESIWPKYELIIQRFVALIDTNKETAVKEISKFKEVRRIFEGKMHSKDYLESFLTKSEYIKERVA